MKHMGKKALAVLLCLVLCAALLPVGVMATTVASGNCGYTGNNCTWSLDNNGNLTITGSGRMADYTSTRPAPWAEYTVRTVNIESISYIGNYAFSWNNNLTSVVIGGTVSEIGIRAFYQCSSLESVKIPSSVTTVGYEALGGCVKLKTAGPLDSGCSIEFNWLLWIPANAFSGCTGLRYVIIPNGMTEICDSAFVRCLSLHTVVLPRGIQKIDDSAFHDSNDSLNTVFIPDTVTYIGPQAFGSGLKDVYYYGDNTSHIPGEIPPTWEDIEIDSDNAALNAAEVHRVDLADYGKGLCSTANDNYLDRVSSADWALFGDGTLLISGKGEMEAYSDTSPAPWGTEIENVVFDGGVTKIGSSAFKNCRKLTEITIPVGMLEIGSRAFSGCSGLTGVSIPYTVWIMGEEVFAGCDKLKTMGAFNCDITCTWSSFIPTQAFSGCTGLTSADIRDGVTEIGHEAYNGCSNLTYVELPASLDYIGCDAFAGCTKLTDVVFQGTMAQWDSLFICDGNEPLLAANIRCSDSLFLSNITVDKSSAAVGDTVIWTATATGGTGTLRYCFNVLKDGAVVQKGSYSTTKTCSYTPTEAGTYNVKVYVKDSSGKTVVSKNGSPVTVAGSSKPLRIAGVSLNPTATTPGATLTWTASAEGGSGALRYNFYVYKDGAVVKKTGYTTAKTASYTAADAGTYSVKVFVKDGASAIVTQTGGSVVIAAPAGPLTVSSITVNPAAASPGATLTWTAAASGGTGALRYNFYIYKDGTVVKKTGYTTAKTASYTAADAGTYSVKVFVKDGASTIATKTGGAVTVGSATGALTVNSLTVNPAAASPGATLTWTASASGGTGTLRYNFYIYKDGTVVKKTGYSTAKTASYTAADAGTYSVKVFVKDGASTIVTKIGGSVTVAAPAGPLTVSSLTVNKTSASAGQTITWTASASGGTGDLRYNFYIYKDGAVVKKTGYTAAKTASYTPADAGKYTVKVFVKDGASTIVTKTGGACLVS